MSIPEGYEKLAVIGIAYKGDYTPGAPYKTLNAVYYGGSTFVALKDNPTEPPVHDGTNWNYLAKGFVEGLLSAMNAVDTSGLMGTNGATVNAQNLLDVIADKVATKLLPKTALVSQIVNDETKAASAASLYRVNEDVWRLNSDLGSLKNNLGSIQYYFFNNLNYTHDTTINMIQDYYGQIPNDTIALCRFRLTGPETCALIQRTNINYGSFISLGYSTGFAKGRKENGVWMVENL